MRGPIVAPGHWSRGSYPLKARTLPSFSLHFSGQQNWPHCVIWGGKESTAPPIHLGPGECFEQCSSQHWLFTCACTHTQMCSSDLATLSNQRETPAGRAIDAFVTGWLFPLGEGGAGRREGQVTNSTHRLWWGLAGVNIQYFSLYEWAGGEEPPGSYGALPLRNWEIKSKKKRHWD